MLGYWIGLIEMSRWGGVTGLFLWKAVIVVEGWKVLVSFGLVSYVLEGHLPDAHLRNWSVWTFFTFHIFK